MRKRSPWRTRQRASAQRPSGGHGHVEEVEGLGGGEAGLAGDDGLHEAGIVDGKGGVLGRHGTRA
ncbi:MAG: hypothetical protein H6811_02705 [Phycisphaeraceae bacterium]|nr:hypothetical protein [Phycisphaeraceae bacterium]